MFAASLAVPACASAQPAGHWASEIAEASSRFGVPPQWIASVMRIESDGQLMMRGRPVVSSAGAMGLMQLMPGTWRDMRNLLRLGADPFDPRDNILAGAAYLRLMYDRFGYPGLFAAYNAGPARYSASLSGTRRLPAETRNYVTRAVGAPPARPRDTFAAQAGIFAVARGTRASRGMARDAAPGAAPLFVILGGR